MLLSIPRKLPSSHTVLSCYLPVFDTQGQAFLLTLSNYNFRYTPCALLPSCIAFSNRLLTFSLFIIDTCPVQWSIPILMNWTIFGFSHNAFNSQLYWILHISLNIFIVKGHISFVGVWVNLCFRSLFHFYKKIVRQIWILWLILFLMGIGEFFYNTLNTGEEHGIQWQPYNRLSHLDYADDAGFHGKSE